MQRVLERCETAIKTNGPLYKHLKLGVSPNKSVKLTIVLLSTDMPLLLQNKPQF